MTVCWLYIAYTMSSQQSDLKACLPDSYVYTRLQNSYKSEFSDMNYNEFLAMNHTFISKLSKKDTTWLSGLCTRINTGGCKVVDGDSCSDFGAESYYFTKNGKLCIMGGM